MTTSRPGVPAWKRLGLKLKYANEIPVKIPTNGTSSTDIHAAQISFEEPPSNALEPPKKKRKTERVLKGSSIPRSFPNTNVTAHHPEKTLKKQVSFSADTKSAAPTANGHSTQDESKSEESQTSTNGKKSKKKSAKKLQQLPAQKSNAALGYLDHYHTARLSWKFNKNRETWILKHLFSENDIPRDHDLALAEYIRGLQGTGARDRLKTQCLELLKKEKETQDGSDEIKDDTTRSEKFAQRLMDDLNKPATSEGVDREGDEEDRDYESWIRQQSRPKLLVLALGLDEQILLSNGTDLTSGTGAGHVNGVSAAAKEKKRKNRTVIVEYESSNSSSSDSSSESEDEERIGKTSNGDVAEEETSSSGSDEETSSSDSESSSEDS